jgi:hypothetical protein
MEYGLIILEQEAAATTGPASGFVYSGPTSGYVYFTVQRVQGHFADIILF